MSTCSRKAEDARIDLGLVAACLRQRPAQVALIGGIKLAVAVHVGAIDRKAGDQLLDRPHQQGLREVGGARILPRQSRHVAGEHVELTGHLIVHDVQLAQPPDLGEGALLAGELASRSR